MTARRQSYAWCAASRAARAKNFYYSFLLLSREQRDAMCAIYAFMRYCDDLSDDEGTPTAPRHRALARGSGRALSGNARTPAVARFHDAVERYKIPHEYFFDMIEGVSSIWSRAASRPSTNSTTTAITWPAWWGSPSSTSSASNRPTLCCWPKSAASRSSSPTFCATCARMPKSRVYLPADDLPRFGAELAERGMARSDGLALMRFEAARARTTTTSPGRCWSWSTRAAARRCGR